MRKSRVKELILKLLMEHPEGVLQSNIHKALGVSKSRVSEVLKELENSGVIVRLKVGNQYLIKVRRNEGKEVGLRKVLRLGIVWSSEYPFITLFAKYLERSLGYFLDVLVYTNALEATWALANGDIDLVLSPLITQLYAYSLTKSLKIIGGGAYGGSFILENPRADKELIASSELSAMDACRAIAINEGLLSTKETYYFTNPKSEIPQLIRSGGAKYLVIWHPLIEFLRPLNPKIVARCDDLELHYCCTLASRTTLSQELRNRISEIFVKAIEDFLKCPERCLEWYSLKVGIPTDILRKGLKYYGFRPYVDVNLIYKTLAKVGINVPSPNLVKEVVET